MKQITTPAWKLFVICLVCSLCLGICSEITKEPIAAQAKATQDAAMEAVLPNASFEEMAGFTPVGTVTGVNVGSDASGNTVGYVLSCTTSSFGGPLKMMVGVDLEGTVTGVRILSHADTPGLGALATSPDFYEQYTGKSGTLAVDKDGGEIVAITSATITSRAVTVGVNDAINWVMENGGAK
ncbi:RnfABCDGE type electron transport complex subunit G [Lachnospiraceae bacterium NSJ-143]|nr:RnfABCDGE type electron transport complex subunit G [Lachnospiraceae bacterium NSJ-143]